MLIFAFSCAERKGHVGRSCRGCGVGASRHAAKNKLGLVRKKQNATSPHEQLLSHLPTDHTYLPRYFLTYLEQDVDARARRSLNNTLDARARRSLLLLLLLLIATPIFYLRATPHGTTRASFDITFAASSQSLSPSPSGSSILPAVSIVNHRCKALAYLLHVEPRVLSGSSRTSKNKTLLRIEQWICPP